MFKCICSMVPVLLGDGGGPAGCSIPEWRKGSSAPGYQQSACRFLMRQIKLKESGVQREEKKGGQF